ncbi:MAG: hypothetical protein A2452_11295 [Candidatus Firestonebacteria bacterium RIFOXYC2_FULL_39_67]|nr:MAG: hypothetical protein A2536_10065 [Candidatus Firestonebacteria bacterium RIFOXYD2_FULL_39_29]OGF54531.1 MAG: hypothetical protein A2452_11295 [Candidatus Firestonebacteria bacterium RIFOXYC2_FULL_39_67]
MREPKIGFLPLYLELYDKFDPKIRDEFKNIVEELKKMLSLNAFVVSSGIVTKKKEADCMERIFKKAKVEAVFTFHLSYSPSYLVSSILARFGKPVFFLNTTMTGSYKRMKPEFLMQNHGIHGVMDLASVLRSYGKSYNIISGYHKDKEFKEKIKKTLKNIAAAGSFKGQKIGITGKPFEMMGDFAVPFGLLKKKYGASVVTVKESEVVSEMKKIKSTAITKEIKSDRIKYRMLNVPENVHEEGVRSYLAMKSIVCRKKLDAFTMNFLDYKIISVPFYAIDRLMEDGLGYAGEGDVLTAMLKKLIEPFARNLMFTEFFCPDWKRGLILMSHMGESNPVFAEKKTRHSIIAKKAFGSDKLTMYHKYKAEKGMITFVNISKLPDGGFKLVTGLLNIIDEKLFDCLDMPQFSVKPFIPVGDFLEKYSMAGGGHHIYIAKGNITGDILNAGTVLGMQALKI